MPLIQEQIIAEDESTVTIKFLNRAGTRFKEKTVNKVEGMTNEDLLKRWHRRMTLEYLRSPISFKRVSNES
jgi:hypothetical protein